MEVRKRDRVPKACAQCRRKKTKCNGQSPCGLCFAQNLECLYEGNKIRRRREKVTDKMASRLLTLETMVSQLVNKLEPLAGRIEPPKASPSSIHKPASVASQDSTGCDTSLECETETLETNRQSEKANSTCSYTEGSKGKNSIFLEYKSVLESGQDSLQTDDKFERKFGSAAQYKGPQLGFSILLSEQSINYVKSKLGPQDHRLVVPMQTLPFYMAASKRAFNAIWMEPQVQTEESIAKLKAGCFPDEGFIEEILQLFNNVHFANFICDVDYVRSLFHIFYENKRREKPHPKPLLYSELMIMCVVMVLCVSAYVDIRNNSQFSQERYPKISRFSLGNLVAFQESIFKNAVFYYYRICTISEGLASIQALLLMAVHLETSWVISDLNFSLTSMAVRYAQDMGLHRLDSIPNLEPEEREKRAKLWRACQHCDIEVCYRLGKPPSVNLLDVSADNIFAQDSSGQSLDFGQRTLCSEYDKLSYIRCHTYMRLFSAQVKYDSLKHIQEEVSSINADMFRLAESIQGDMRPHFYNVPEFDNLLRIFTDGKTEAAHTEMLMCFYLTYFNHFMTVNRVPWAVVSDTNGSSAHENSRFRKLSLDSARTILHIIRTFDPLNSSILSFNWLVTYPFLAITNLLSNCLNNPLDPDVLKDLSLLIDVSFNTFGKIGARAEEDTTRLFYMRVRMADIMIRVIMRVVITIVDQTLGTNIFGSNPCFLEHLQMVEKRYPKLYQRMSKLPSINLFLCVTHPENHGYQLSAVRESVSEASTKSIPSVNSDTVSSLGLGISSTPLSGDFSPGLGALEAIDFLEYGDKLGMDAMNGDFAEPGNQDYLNMPNFFFDNGL